MSQRADAHGVVDTEDVSGPPPLSSLSAEAPKGSKRARLSVLLGPGEGRVLEIDREVIVGRGPEADLSLDDPGVSQRHAQLRRLPDGHFEIEDLSSKNGTFIGGTAITRAQLQPGARIQVGARCLLAFDVLDPLEESLLQAQQIELVGKVAAGLNHDLNNLLCVIMANAAHLRDLPRGMSLGHADVRECLQDMHGAAVAGAELADRMATFAVGSAMVPTEVLNFSALCRETLSGLRRTFPRSIEVREHVQPGLHVRGLASAVQQMIVHPCLNARDAMPQGGTLWFEALMCGRRDLDDPEFAPFLWAEHYIVVHVRDTGPGVSETVARRAFEPFFTTKPVAVGSGLGLAIVRKVAHDLGGRARLYSEAEVGTTLTIAIPAAVAEDPRAQPRGLERDTLDDRPVSVAPASQGRVLAADDNDVVRRVVARALRRSGYDVVEARDGDEVLERFDDGAYDLAILDIDMPRLDGLQCAAQLRARSPQLPIVLLSGVVDKERNHIADVAPDVVLRKPLDLVDLLEGISRAIERRRG